MSKRPYRSGTTPGGRPYKAVRTYKNDNTTPGGAHITVQGAGGKKHTKLSMTMSDGGVYKSKMDTTGKKLRTHTNIDKSFTKPAKKVKK